MIALLDSYNEQMEQEGKEESKITYTDTVGTLMSSVTQIVDIISYVLIAVVAVSLVVSSIMIGVITWLLLIPVNMVIHYLAGIDNINEILSGKDALILIVISVVLTVLGGLIPSGKASRNDPVTALRTE